MEIVLTREQRKKTGSFFTPSSVARRIIDLALERWLSRKTAEFAQRRNRNSQILEVLDEISILDPAAGDGAFLMEAGRALYDLRKKWGDSREAAEIRMDIVRKNLFGVDIQYQNVEACRDTLEKWICTSDQLDPQLEFCNVVQGNSLLGPIHEKETHRNPNLRNLVSWERRYPRIFRNNESGFDLVVGNPPYGNILTLEEKKYLRESLSYDVMTGKEGTWNIAPLFLVRAKELLHSNGVIGFLLPNSILRVRQFSKVRRFIRMRLGLWCIIDEGNPFSDVTLEMVSLLCDAKPLSEKMPIEIISRQSTKTSVSHIPRSSLKRRIVSIYQDDLYEELLKKGRTGVLKASRGRDIPSGHVSFEPTMEYSVPYATKGRSVGRYRFNEQHLLYANDWFMNDKGLRYSFTHSFLVATKNLPYPRCAFKPEGVLHGGGIVRIFSNDEELNMKAVGVILNSTLIEYISRQYLTNRSNLTTCLNTGIIEEIPLVLPDDSSHLEFLFNLLQEAHHKNRTQSDATSFEIMLQRFADAYVYGLYFQNHIKEFEILDSLAAEIKAKKGITSGLQGEIRDASRVILTNPLVRRIDTGVSRTYLDADA